jgi:fimbrial chaperone protein
LVRRVLLAIVAFLVGLSSGAPASAFRFSPLVMEFEPSGSGAHKTYRVENDGDVPNAIQITMVRRLVDANGKESLPEEEDDFVVFPPQMVLQPGETRSIRVQWVGDPTPPAELAYRIIAEQLPVDFESETSQSSGISLVIRYAGSVYIAPPGIHSDLSVSGEVAEMEDGTSGLKLIFRNPGTSHIILRQLKLSLTAATAKTGLVKKVLEPDQLDGIRSENILAGHERHFVIPWPEGLPKGAVTVEAETTWPR